MELRPYQSEAVAAVYAHLRNRDDHPCVVIPTAGGKTPVMAAICRDAVQQWNGRVLILAHVKELLEQATGKLNAMAPDLRAVTPITRSSWRASRASTAGRPSWTISISS